MNSVYYIKQAIWFEKRLEKRVNLNGYTFAIRRFQGIRHALFVERLSDSGALSS